VGASIRFETIEAAKDYLVEKIVAEAARQSVALSNVEREMLYFTEDFSEPMEAANEAFDREYDTDEYEAKIGSIVRSIESRNTPEEQDKWDEAVVKLSEGDHYLPVLINGAAPRPAFPSFLPKCLQRWLPALDRAQPPPPGDRLRLIVVGFIIFVFIFVVAALSGHR
jgi:hypothetical protein